MPYVSKLRLNDILYDVKDAEKIRRYDTVAQMKADSTLKDGDYARTGGYYAVNDDGGALYRIYYSAPATYYEILANDLYAMLIPGETVFPEMFGAHGDGTTDDTAAIQAAINSGIPVCFTAELYVITDTLTINNAGKIDLISFCGSSIKRLQTEDAAAKYNIISISSDDVVIDGLTIVGNEYHHSTGGSLEDDGRTNIKIYDVSNVNIRNCNFKHIGSNGIYCSMSDNITVLNCEFSKTTAQAGDAYAHSLVFVKCYNTKVIGNYFHDIDDGITGSGTWTDSTPYINHTWSGNVFDTIYEHAIYGNLSGQSIIGNVIKNCKNSAIKVRSINTVISSNLIDSVNSGISVSEPSRYCNVCDNNIYLHNMGATDINVGIGINASNLKSILERYEGCSSSDRMVGHKISNNTIQFAAGSATGNGYNIGIRMYASSNYSTVGDYSIQKTSIVNNTIINAETGILFLNNTAETDVLDNRLIGVSPSSACSDPAYGNGISYYNGYSHNTRVYRNVIKGFYNGIDRRVGTGTCVFTFYRDNEITDNKGYGLYFVSGTISSGMVVTENRFLNNESGDILTESLPTIYNNSLYDSTKRYGYPPYRGGAAPTSGTFKRGDVVLNVSPSSGGYAGWICVSGGTPGTWEGFGTIA